MNGKILAGLVTALVYGGSAMAQDAISKDQDKAQQERSPDNIGGSGLESDLHQADTIPPPVDMGLQGDGVGGSGDMKVGHDGIGGAGPVAAPVPPPPPPQHGGMSLFCTPIPQGAGGSGVIQHDLNAPPVGHEQSSLQREFDSNEGIALGGSGFDDVKVKEIDKRELSSDEGQRKGDMRGLTLLVGGGVEGYTGALAPEVNPGASVGVTAAIKPSKVLGIELGYTGAVNNFSTDVGGSGPDIIRNGGQAALTLGLTASPVQPYVLGGVGVSRYNVRNGGEALGFRSDTTGNVPVGVGLRTHIGDFTADARVNYNFLLANQFSTGVENDLWNGRYTGTLNLGGTF